MRSFYMGLLLLILFCISPQKSDQAKSKVFYYAPDPWEIERFENQRIKPYDDQHKHNTTLIGSIKDNKSCFGDGEGDYRIVNFTNLKLKNMAASSKHNLDKVVDKYLSKYCKKHWKCRIDEDQNKFVCVHNPGNNFGEAGGKNIGYVVNWIGVYLLYQADKFKLGGKKKPIEDKKPCVQPPYKLPFTQEPNKMEQQKLNEEAYDYLGEFCKSGRCYYDYSSKTFLCRSSAIQPIAALIVTLLILIIGHVNYQY